MIPLLLNFRKGTIRDELDQFFETLAGDSGRPLSVTDGAFCRARRKLKPGALDYLNRVLVEIIEQRIAVRRWRGFRLLAVDGSTGRLPDTPDIDQHFGRPRDSGVPLARFSRLYDVLNGLVVQADMEPYHTGERDLAAAYLLELKVDDLLLYDRGYPAFWLFAFHHSEQRHYCARVKRDFHPEVTAFIASGAKSRTLMLTPGPASARQCREGFLPDAPIPVRLVRVTLSSGEIEVLITSLTDESAYPSSWFAKLYALRWGIEENYKREKQRLEVENFSGRSAWVLMQDFYAKIIAQNLAAVFVFLAQWLANERYRHRQHDYRINGANALSKMKGSLVRLFLHRSSMDWCWRLLEMLAACVEAIRPDRSYPRNMKKVRVPGFQPNYKRCR